MPTVRIMPDGRCILATPGKTDPRGYPIFNVGGGNTISLTLDYTLFLGSDTLDSSTWTINNATQGAETISGAIVTTLLVMPSVLIDEFSPSSARVGLPVATSYVVHRLVTTAGRIQNTPVWFSLQPAIGTEELILDGSYLI